MNNFVQIEYTPSNSIKPERINPAREETLQSLASNYKKISEASDNITTINYTDSTKSVISSIVQTSALLGLTSTETFNNSGETTLVITRVLS